MASGKREVEFLLSFIDAEGRIGAASSRHLLEAVLAWPRVSVMSKSVTLPVMLKRGMTDIRGLPWYRRVLFKEGVEHRFALRFRVSEGLGKSAFNAFMRGMGSSLFGAAETLIETRFAGVAGDVLSSPFEYGRRALAKSADIEYILEGGIDLDAAEISGRFSVEVPLFITKDVYSSAGRVTGGERGGKPSSRKRLFREGDSIGCVSVEVNVL